MLGDLILEVQGRVAESKSSPNGKREVNAAVEGLLLEEKFSGSVKGETMIRPDGTVSSNIDGSFDMKGGETVRFSAITKGTNVSNGKFSYKGAICFSCPPGRFVKLNGIAVAYDVDVDETGFIRGRGWEWK